MRDAIAKTMLCALLAGCNSGDGLIPSIETCGDGRDDDHDGTVDESCPCSLDGCDAGAARADAGSDAGISDAGASVDACDSRPVLLQPDIGGSLVDAVATGPDELVIAWIDGTDSRVRLLRATPSGETLGAPVALEPTTGATSFDLFAGSVGTMLVWASEGSVVLAELDPATLALGSEQTIAPSVGARAAMGADVASGSAVYATRDAAGTPTGLSLARVTDVGTTRRDPLASVSALRSFHVAPLADGLAVLWDEYARGVSALELDGAGSPRSGPTTLRASGAHARLARSRERLALLWIDASGPAPVLTLATAATTAGLAGAPTHAVDRGPDARLAGAQPGAAHDVAADELGGFLVVWVDDDSTLRGARFDASDRSVGEWVIDSVADPDARPVLVPSGSGHVVLYTGGLRRHLRLARVCAGG